MEGLLLLKEQQTLMGPVSVHRMTHGWYIILVERQETGLDPIACPSAMSSIKPLTWIAFLCKYSQLFALLLCYF